MINEEILLLDRLTEYYEEEIRKNLKLRRKSLSKIFKRLINSEASNYDLISENSIKESVYIKITSRIKDKNSFREKLIRRNLGLKLINKLKLTDENFVSKKGEIDNEVTKFDDIIGLRFVCDLNRDCPKALEMLKNNISYLEGKKVKFIIGELDNQPEVMVNGLSIYRLKGIYDDRVGFELQIKSKIDEAWGELDHFIFYKDYSFFPSKDTVQQTMNNVGKMLDKIEHLLFDLRSSKDNYNKNLKNSLFIESLEKSFSESIKALLGFPYQIEKLSPIIKHLIKEEESNILEKPIKQNLNFDFLNFKSNGTHLPYINSRKVSFELKIIESIYQLIWQGCNNQILSQENYSTFLDSLINHIKDNILKIILSSDTLIEYSIINLEEDLQFLLKYDADESIWISAKKHSEFLAIYALVIDFISDFFEHEIEENLIDDNEKEVIRKIFLACHFNADLNKIVENEKLNFTQKIIFEFKKNISENKFSNKEYKNVIKYTTIITNSFEK